MTAIASAIPTPLIESQKLEELIWEAARCYGYYKRMETLLTTLAPGRSMENAASDATLERGYERGKRDAEAAYNDVVAT